MARTTYTYTRATYVDPFPGQADEEIYSSEACHRCGGAQVFEAYRHTYDGVCFRCNGEASFREVTTIGDMRKAAMRQVKATNHQRRELAKALLRFQEGTAAAAEQRPEWATLVRGEGVLGSEGNEFVLSLVERMEQGKDLTEKQVQAGADAITRYANRDAIAAAKAAEQAARPAVVVGRQVLTGTVRSTKEQDGNYGTTWKMLLEDTEGRRYWGTIPQSIWDGLQELGHGYNLEALVGLQVSMTATVKASTTDHDFGFYSRPTKATLCQ